MAEIPDGILRLAVDALEIYAHHVGELAEAAWVDGRHDQGDELTGLEDVLLATARMLESWLPEPERSAGSLVERSRRRSKPR